MRVKHGRSASEISHLDPVRAGDVYTRHQTISPSPPSKLPEFGALEMSHGYVRRCLKHGVQVSDQYDPSHSDSVFCPMSGGHWTNSWFVAKSPHHG